MAEAKNLEFNELLRREIVLLSWFLKPQLLMHVKVLFFFHERWSKNKRHIGLPTEERAEYSVQCDCYVGHKTQKELAGTNTWYISR